MDVDGRQLLNSPLLARRLGRRGRLAESSDEDAPPPTGAPSGGAIGANGGDPARLTAHNYHDLESFQKAQLLNKVRIATSLHQQLVHNYNAHINIQ